MNYVDELAKKLDEMGCSILGKDLTDESICKELLSSITALEDGRAALMRFNDSQRADAPVITCSFCEELIPHGETYLYTKADDVEAPFHHACYPWDICGEAIQ